MTKPLIIKEYQLKKFPGKGVGRTQKFLKFLKIKILYLAGKKLGEVLMLVN